MEVDDTLRQMILDLGRWLSEAILDSSDATEVVHQLRQEGYCLYLLVGSEEAEGEPPARRRRLPLRLGSDEEPRSGSSEPTTPGFVIHGQDLAFLKSIGIDPTRSLRRRKKNAR